MTEFYIILIVFIIGLGVGLFFLLQEKQLRKKLTLEGSQTKLLSEMLGIETSMALKDVIIAQDQLLQLHTTMESTIVGQREFVVILLLSLVSGSHCFIQSLPGLAKTSAVKNLCTLSGLQFGRIQGTPDLLPSDIIGFEMADGTVKQGVIMNNLILFDEINRASPKLQSAILQAMEEKSVSIGSHQIDLPRPFIVFATANPSHSQGVYRLPEAQMDRFGLSVYLNYPQEEEKILLQTPITHTYSGIHLDFDAIYDAIRTIAISDDLIVYIKELLQQTRNHQMIAVGCSPRAGKDLIWLAKSLARIQNKSLVEKSDIDMLVDNCFGHRVTFSRSSSLS